MKRKLLTIFASVMLLLVVVVALTPQPAKAADILSSLACAFSPANCAIKLVAGDFMMSIFASIGNAILQVSAWFLSMAGIILNISIILTMNIKAIYEATPAIKDVWIVIRNLSSIFIIFVLLYASISTILDVGKTNIKELVGKIIMAGLLINFSLFFTKVAIDASNLISLQFYRAIVPTSASASITKDTISEILSASYTGGGISDVFMYNLKITKIYNKDSTQNGLLSETNGGSYFKIAVSTFAGFALMMIAALSIFAAAIAFIIRLVILLLLMGFSPIYFAGMIFPDVKSNISDKWLGWLKDQLIFMPVYLLLLYVALRFISTMNPAGKAEGFMLALDKAQSTAGANTSGSGILLSGVGILFQYTIALIMINIPLIAAAKTGGISTQWGTTASKWVSGKLKSGAKSTAGFVGQQTIGRGAKAIQADLATSDFASRNPNIAVLANKTIGKVSGASFGGEKGGYEKRQKEFVKARTEFGNKSIKINDVEKKKAIADGVTEWENKTNSLTTKYDAAMRLASDPLITNVAEKNRLIKEAAEIKVEIDARNKAAKSGKIDKYLEDEALKNKKKEYAENLTKSYNPFTAKSRKEAAKAIRDELSKDEDKKLNDKIKKMMEASEKADEPKDDKPKDDK